MAPSMSPPCQRPKPASCWSSCRCCATCRAWDVSDLESRTFLKPVHLSLKDEDEDVDVCTSFSHRTVRAVQRLVLEFSTLPHQCIRFFFRSTRCRLRSPPGFPALQAKHWDHWDCASAFSASDFFFWHLNDARGHQISCTSM